MSILNIFELTVCQQHCVKLSFHGICIANINLQMKYFGFIPYPFHSHVTFIVAGKMDVKLR